MIPAARASQEISPQGSAGCHNSSVCCSPGRATVRRVSSDPGVIFLNVFI